MASCPNCGKEMDHGFLGAESLLGGARWFDKKSTLALGGEPLVKPAGSGMVWLEGHRCTDCRLLLLNYSQA